ncbi:conserved hypothetical protein [Leishmania mexicana MHOM/GT/2001/U1103]|uniref:C3H1-type domain-containing protein n=1 Tax=Leishmania mexicana (strain MHOM/GT/2001/U1103) TaxID=929439 RepID=E9B1B2_LEIMU|nr:conserved hypothetical protein [Leishmania mexicana MHOM/GT/2001/U1103]CBZ29018.1 conserved hypothetical protein [Leishmania mexicana MHOM/GT/2001/U1103]
MGGCCKGARCPFSHELVQLPPKGVDASGGYFISGNVANYKAAASTTAASPSSRSLGGRWDNPTASSSTDGLSTLASPSSCCVTTGTSLSAEAKEWVGADSAAASSSANSATASITSVQSLRGAASPTVCVSSSSLRYRSSALRRPAQQVSPLPMPHSQRDSQPQPQSQQTPTQLQSQHSQKPPPSPSLSPLPPQPHPQPQLHQQQKLQYQPPPQPRSVANALSALLPNHSESSAAAETPRTSAAPAHPAATARTVSFTQSSNGSGSTTIAALASFFDMQRVSTGAPSAPPSSTVSQPSKAVFVTRRDDQTPATALSPAAAAPPRYTAACITVAASAQRFNPSPSAPTILTTATTAPAHGSGRSATPSQHLEAPLPRSREALATGAEHHAANVAKAHVGQSTAPPPAAAVPPSLPQYEPRTASSTQIRVMPPAPRSQQQQAAHQAQQLRAQQEAQHQAQIQQQRHTPKQVQQLAQQQAQLQQLQQQIQPQKQQQQQTVYMLTPSRLPASSTPPHEGITAPAQLPLGYTLAYAVPAPTPTAPAATPILISEQPSAARPTYTLLSSCPPQSQLQSLQTAKGTVLYGTPAQVLTQAAAPSESGAPRLILVNTDGTFTVLQAEALAATAGFGLSPAIMQAH